MQARPETWLQLVWNQWKITDNTKVNSSWLRESNDIFMSCKSFQTQLGLFFPDPTAVKAGRWRCANQSSKSIYKCTGAGQLARGHSVLFTLYLVSTSISHLSTRGRQRMFSVTFSSPPSPTSECDLADLAAFCLHVGSSHSFFRNTPAVDTLKTDVTSKTHFSPGLCHL